MTNAWLDARNNEHETESEEHEPVTDPERLADMALLSNAIAASGLSASAFARDVLVRNPRQIFRSLKGENPLSPVVRAKCQAVIDLAKPKRMRQVGTRVVYLPPDDANAPPNDEGSSSDPEG